MIKRMPQGDRSNFRHGALKLSILTGAVAYWNYRERIRKEFLRSEGHYRLESQLTNITPWK